MHTHVDSTASLADNVAIRRLLVQIRHQLRDSQTVRRVRAGELVAVSRGEQLLYSEQGAEIRAISPLPHAIRLAALNAAGGVDNSEQAPHALFGPGTDTAKKGGGIAKLAHTRLYELQGFNWSVTFAVSTGELWVLPSPDVRGDNK